MANEQSGVKFFVILTLLCLSTRIHADEDDDGEGSPILDVMQTLLKESTNGQGGGGLNMLGPMLQTFLQSGGGKQIGEMLSGSGKKSPALSILSGLGALMQAQARNGDENSGGGFDPAMLGTVIDLFSSLNEAGGKGEKKIQGAKKDKQENSIDWEPVLNVVGNAVSSMMTAGKDSRSAKEGGGNGMEALLSFLPVIMSSLGGRHPSHASGNVKHHQHEPFLPPFLENLHEYWDHFTSSEFGRALWENSGLAGMVAQFQDESTGRFNPAKVFESLENNTFRRKWIKGISSFFAEWANHIADSDTQKRYIDTVQVVANGFLQSEGYPKKALLNLKKPGESISALTDEVFRRQLNLQVDSAQYVKPAIHYFQEVFGQTKRSGVLSGITAETIESRLSSTLENQLIEPILRANRAYRFALKNPQCSKYILCVISSDRDTPQHAVGIKPAVIKASSMATAWFLSEVAGASFFELIGTDGACKKHDEGCADFHEEDVKATTEYFHNEL